LSFDVARKEREDFTSATNQKLLKLTLGKGGNSLTYLFDQTVVLYIWKPQGK